MVSYNAGYGSGRYEFFLSFTISLAKYNNTPTKQIVFIILYLTVKEKEEVFDKKPNGVGRS